MSTSSRVNPTNWDCSEVSSWLEELGFSQYVSLFEEQNIDGQVLLCLSEDDLRSEPLKLSKIGDIKKIYNAIEQLKGNNRSGRTQGGYLADVDEEFSLVNKEDKKKKRRTSHSAPSSPLHSEPESSMHADSPPPPPPYHVMPTIFRNQLKLLPLQQQLKNAAASFIYLSLSVFSTSMIMTFVHERVPDQLQFRPLPDLFLDNIKHIEWAFKLTEIIALFLLFLFSLIFLFHRYRFIMLWRCNIILGTIFFLRCVTMVVTSLSVPGAHIKCSRSDIGINLEDKLRHAWNIASGLGMSLNGVRTCGDYMFSGHTVVVTILNFAITEYTPDHWKSLHVVSWILNAFGMFFVLASHEHYSIDVFVAFYISHRLFLYYHSLANSNALRGVDKHRMSSFFPLFAIFEEGTEGRVPNEFEWPWKPIMRLFAQARRSREELARQQQ